MSYCPECGSEVANNDVFCAYCGISLQVMIEPEVSESSSVDNSPILGSPEKIQTSATLDQEPIASNESADSTSVQSADSEEKSAEIQPEEVPQNLPETLTQTSEQIVDTTADYNIPASEPTIEESKIQEPIFEIPKPESPFKINEPFPVDPFSETLPYTSSDYAEQELIAPSDEVEVPAFEDKEQNNFDSINTEDEFNKALGNDLVESHQEDNDPIELPKTEEMYYQNDKQNDDISIELPDLEAQNVEDALKLEEKAVSEKLSEIVIPAIDEPTPVFETPIVSTPVYQEPVSEKIQYPEDNVETPFYGQVDQPVVSKPIEEAAVPQSISESPVAVDLPVSIKPFVEESKELVNVQSNEVATPIASVESDEKRESRSFTNPINSDGDTDGRSKQKLKPLTEGTVLNNRYEVIRKIGGGGMGAVYLANDKNLGGVLRAVKEMVQSYIEDQQQEKAVNDFKRESLLLTSLEHQGIPTIYDYFYDEKEGRFYLVMKYISGGDLAARLRSAPEGRVDEVSVTDWAIQIVDVLDYLHNRQPPIVYRDLKPSNIMIDGNSGKLMVIDFGIARWVNKEEKGVTAVGTMGYAPPELFSGNVEPRSDIYSLGSTMFHLLTGADPQSNPLLIFDFNKNPRPRQINPSLSDQMEQILMRAVEYNSDQRFASAAEMRNELVKHLENLRKGTVTFGVVNDLKAGQPISNVPVFCGFCGQKIVATDMFCPFCGAQQPMVGQSQRLNQTVAPTYSTSARIARLSVIGTNDLDRTEYSLEKDNNLLGRRDPMSNIFPEVDMSKFDPQTKISRKHARIWREGERFFLEDLGSSNGTIVFTNDNQPVRLLPRQPHGLSHGDKLRLGDTTLLFTIG